MAPVDLSDKRIDALVSLIKDSFRVRPNQDPIYVDIGGNLARIASKQHQVIFGRRGSGKSCLLVHFHRRVARDKGILSIYIDSDEIKRLSYPDVLIRLLVIVTEGMPGKRRGWLARLLRKKPTPLEAQEDELRGLLDLAESSEVTEEQKTEAQRTAEAKIAQGPASGSVGRTSGVASGWTSRFTAEKLDTIERHFQDYKNVLVAAFNTTDFDSAAIIIDDFYLFQRTIQPDIVDYLHRLLRGTDLYLKLGTVRHRTTLLRHDGQPIGIDPSQDVEDISLDRTFEDVDSTEEFLGLMLDELCRGVGIDAASDFVSGDGLLHLTLASGGVPRDYLNTLVEAVPSARSLGQQRVTPRTVYKGAGRLSYRTKLKNLRDDVAGDSQPIEDVFGDLATFCLKEERKTGFLVSQADVREHEAEHEIIQQLMDFKLIHVIESDTSAASGRPGRYEAYTLDFALFMEPRLRGISHVEFWKTDEQRRRKGVREAPHYSLVRAHQATSGPPGESPEEVVEGIEAEVGTEPDAGE